jgi:hypothetical protein
MKRPGLEGSKAGEEWDGRVAFCGESARKGRVKRRAAPSSLLKPQRRMGHPNLSRRLECWQPGEPQLANFRIALDQVSFGPGLGAT